MEKSKKRDRNVNFVREETEKLISLVETHIDIIENKKSDAVTWQEKEKAWKAIEFEFNTSRSRTFRDAKHLKQKYEALKRDIRKKFSVSAVNEALPLTPIEQKVKEIILLSVEGERYDSDQLEDVASEESSEYVVLAEATVEPVVKVETPMTDDDAADNSNNNVSKMAEKLPKKRYLDQLSNHVPILLTQDVNQDNLESPHVGKPRDKFKKLSEGKSEIVKLQKRLLEEELEEKIIKKQMLREDMKHKNEIFRLQKEEMIFKIEILKMELENKRRLHNNIK